MPGGDGRGEEILVGDRRLRSADVNSVAFGEARERDIGGKLVAFAVFMGLCGLLILLVALGGRPRLLIGAAVVGAIATCSGLEAWWAGDKRYFRVDIRLIGGEVVRFATPSRDLAHALAVAVQRICNRKSRI